MELCTLPTTAYRQLVCFYYLTPTIYNAFQEVQNLELILVLSRTRLYANTGLL
uniref:Uncharacterized protein n=1 Tax=Anguilla anguilla TaxID=7936 RepID=A0A0E9SLK3_ANGAN